MALTAQQKAAITQFVTFTQADKKTAEKVLRTQSWNVQAAVNIFLNSASSRTSSEPHSSNLSRLFDEYLDDKANHPDTVRIDGMMKYCEDLGVALDDIDVLTLSEIVASPTIGEISRTGFVQGWLNYNASTVAAQKKILEDLNSQLPQPAARDGKDAVFNRVYKHTFVIGLPQGSRVMPLDSALAYWRILFGSKGFQWVGSDGTPYLDWWIESQEKRNKPITKDLWNQMPRVADNIMKDPSLGWWNEESSWPSQIDEFVLWMKEEKGVGKQDTMQVDE